jgi:hypothetical protein
MGDYRVTAGKAILYLMLGSIAFMAEIARAGPPKTGDPHYNKIGFFDIHVCNWPDQPLFFLTLFSTKSYSDVARVEVFLPDGRPLGELDLERYRIINKKGEREKRVFIGQIPMPDKAPDGWYSAKVALKNGAVHHAKDYVIIHKMPLPSGMQPPHEADNVPVPKKLIWDPVEGAAHYKVFIRDLWEGGRTVHESKLLTKPYLSLPPGLLKPGGMYSWRVHARDVDGNVLLGDFNHGSLSPWLIFGIGD